MEEYKSNSHKTREGKAELVPEKKAEKVIQGEVRLQEKTKLQRFADVLLADDISNVKSWVIEDVIIPRVKGVISDIAGQCADGFKDFVDKSLYRDGDRPRNENSVKVSYRNYYDQGREYRRDRDISNRPKSAYKYQDVVFDTRGEAEAVLAQMRDYLAQYGLISVGDFYDMVGIDGEHTDNKWGWTDLRNVKVIRVRDGYILNLPKITALY